VLDESGHFLVAQPNNLKMPSHVQQKNNNNNYEQLKLLGAAIIGTKWSPFDTEQIQSLDKIDINWSYEFSKTSTIESSHTKITRPNLDDMSLTAVFDTGGKPWAWFWQVGLVEQCFVT
jgi:hypothetical protein